MKISRPSVKQFLEEVHKMYELHVYTMGSKEYAWAIARALDPDGHLFGDRVLDRQSNESIFLEMTCRMTILLGMVEKNIESLFPMDTSMVVALDDRARVWKYSENLLKVSPCSFIAFL